MSLSRIIAVAITMLPSLCTAASNDALNVDASYLLRLSIGLVLVIAVIFALSWIMRRSGLGKFGGQGPVRILGGASVGQRERVVLVEVGDQQMLIGVAPGNVRALHVLDTPVAMQENKSNSQSIDTAGVFKSILTRAQQKT